MSANDQLPNPLVYFNDRECRVEYIQIEGAKWFDVCLFDVETDEIVAFCTRPEPVVSLKAQQGLVRREFVEALEAAQIARSTGEIIKSERFGDLYKCDFPYGPTHLAWECDGSTRNVAARVQESLEKDEPEFDIEH